MCGAARGSQKSKVILLSITLIISFTLNLKVGLKHHSHIRGSTNTWLAPVSVSLTWVSVLAGSPQLSHPLLLLPVHTHCSSQELTDDTFLTTTILWGFFTCSAVFFQNHQAILCRHQIGDLQFNSTVH